MRGTAGSAWRGAQLIHIHLCSCIIVGHVPICMRVVTHEPPRDEWACVGVVEADVLKGIQMGCQRELRGGQAPTLHFHPIVGHFSLSQDLTGEGWSVGGPAALEALGGKTGGQPGSDRGSGRPVSPS